MDQQEVYTTQLFQFVQDHLQEDPALLLLKHRSSEGVDIKEAVRQIAARQKAKTKLPSWTQNPQVIFPATVPLEQCSSEETARFKSRWAKGKKLIDLTGGFGVDTFFMGGQFDQVVYLERQKELAEIVSWNFKTLSPSPEKFKVLQGDALSLLEVFTGQFDWLYVDPARRGTHNQKLYRLKDCEPDVVLHWTLLKEKAKNIMVKVSPMVDIKEVLKELPELHQVIVVAVKNEVKEVLLIWESEVVTAAPMVYVFDLKSKDGSPFTFTYHEEENVSVAYEMPGKYLIEPSAAILKAGAFKLFAQQFGLKKLHPNTHLYTTDKKPTPLQGRIFEIQEELKLDKKVLKGHFDKGQVNVIVRNHPQKAEVLKKKFRLRDGGEDYLIACTTSDGKARAFRCKRL